MKIAKRHIKTYATIFIVFLLNVTLFQNCSPKPNQTADSSSTSDLLANAPFANGACGSTENSCTAGTFINVADSGTESLWKCQGTGGGSTILCSANFSTTVVNGLCDSKLNSCLQGSVIDIPDATNQAFWICAGFNGGTSANCSASIGTGAVVQNAKCGGTVNSCLSGTFVDRPDTATNNIWSCVGANGGTSVTCNIAITGGGSNNSKCGTTVNSCTSGTFSDLADSATYYLWKCTGTDGTYASCVLPKPSCTLAVTPRAHVGDAVNFTVTTSSALPASVQLKMYGTKSNVDGSNLIADVNGNSQLIATPINFSQINTGGAMAGSYSRKFILADPGTGANICETTTVTYNLTPACGLAVDKGTLNLSESYVLSLNFAVSGEQILKAIPSNVTWYGTQTANGITTSYPLNQGFPVTDGVGGFPKTYGPFNGLTNMIGSYTEHYIATDSAGIEVCKSNNISFSITDVPIVKVDGVCNANTINLCDSGTFSDLADTAGNNTWACNGSNGGVNATCNIPVATVVNGTCGSSSNTCATGTFSDLDDTATAVIWACNGSNGGANITCSTPIAPPAVNGACGTALNTCTSGTAQNYTYNSSDYSYEWTCTGSSGGSDVSCSIPYYYCYNGYYNGYGYGCYYQ
ncbi:MAG: hypothetical protein ACXVAX_02865 [Pseudobdellovibrio sp.]